MSDLDAQLRGYLDDCTSDETRAAPSVEASAGADVDRGRTRLLPVAIAAAATALVVAGVGIVREQVVDPATQPPTTAGVPVDVATESDVVGTWIIDGQQAGFAFLDGKVRVTFLPDGSWSGWDGCNTRGGSWSLTDGGSFAARASSTTLALCPSSDGQFPALQQVQSITAGGLRLLLLDGQGDVVQNLLRAGGEFSPTAYLTDDGGTNYRLVLQTWGSSSCPYVPSDPESEGPNQLVVDSTAVYRACFDDLYPDTRTSPVDRSAVDVSQPISLTLHGLGSAPVTIPVDTSRLTPDEYVAETYDVNIALIEPGYFGNWESRGLVWHRVSIESDGGVAEAAVIGLLQTPSPGGEVGINGMNLGFGIGEPIAVVRSVEVQGDQIVVDLNREVVDPYPTVDCNCPWGEIVMQQLVWSVNGPLNTDLPVLVTAEGQPADTFWGYPLNGPVAPDPRYEPAP